MPRSTIELTEPMQRCLDYMRANGGEIVYYRGGFWARRGIPYTGGSVFTPMGGRNKGWPSSESFFPRPTVRALVGRGILEWSEVRAGAEVAARIKQTEV